MCIRDRPETADGGQTYIDETMFLGDSNTYRLVAYGLTTVSYTHLDVYKRQLRDSAWMPP